MAVKYSNNAYSTLSTAINTTATSISVASASSFPTLSAGDHMYLTIVSETALEVVKVTNVSGTTLTVVRGQDGTSGTAAAAGDRVELRISTIMLQDAFAESNNDVFKAIAVSGQSDIVADSSTDTLTLIASGGTTITTNAGADAITIDTPTAGASTGLAIAMAVAL